MVPKHIIDRVIEVTDLVALVSRHVKLTKSGRDFKGLCPFHQEKRASFHVIPEKRFFFCHGCRASGDAINFVMRMEGKPFVEAVHLLAHAGKVAIPGVSSAEELDRQQLLRVTQVAARFFSEQLWTAPDDDVARRALARRGLREETLHRFGIGLASASWNALTRALDEARLTEDALRVGLITPRRDGQGHVDCFRNRIMVPLREPDGDTRGFCGRLLSGDGPPLLYSKSSGLFRKTELMFGWDVAVAELRKRKRVLLLQGFTDCMLLHQSGLHHAVAALGDPPTVEVLERIKQLGVRDAQVILPHEGPEPDLLLRWARVLIAAELPTAVVELAHGQNLEPMLVRAHLDEIEALMASARPLSIRLFEKLLPRGASSAPEEKIRAFASLAPLMSDIPVGFTRTTFIAAMATHFGLSSSEIEDRLRSATISGQR